MPRPQRPRQPVRCYQSCYKEIVLTSNSNYLPHNGVATIAQFVNATVTGFGMGPDLATFLAIYGSAIDGSGTGWSIGGTPHVGIAGSHGNYEGDNSPTHGDLTQYGSLGLVLNQFKRVHCTSCTPHKELVADIYANSFMPCSQLPRLPTTTSRSCGPSEASASRRASTRTRFSLVRLPVILDTLCQTNHFTRPALLRQRCNFRRLHLHIPLHVQQIGRVSRGPPRQGDSQELLLHHWSREQRLCNTQSSL